MYVTSPMTGSPNKILEQLQQKICAERKKKPELQLIIMGVVKMWA